MINGSSVNLKEDELFRIISNNRLPLCIEYNYINEGYKLVLGQINQDTNNSLFIFQPTIHGYYRIMAFHSGLYLESTGQTDGCYIVQNKENNKTSQQFRFERVRDDQYLIRARNSSQVLTLENGNTQAGARIYQLPYNNSKGQLFRLDSVE